MKNLSLQSIGVLSTDVKGVILSWNYGMEAATGIGASVAEGQSIFDIHNAFETPDIRVRIENVLNHGTTEYLSSRFHPKLATLFKYLNGCHITISPLRQSNEAIIGLLIIAEGNNITDAKPESSAAAAASKVKTLNLPALIHELVNNHRNPAILSSIIDAFKKSDEDFITIAQDLAASTDHEVRMYTAQILGNSLNPKASKILVKLLNDPDSNVIYHAIEALGKRKEIKAIPKLEVIARSGDFFLAAAAIDALISIDAGLNTYIKFQKLFRQPEYTLPGIEMAGRILHLKPFTDLCMWVNEMEFAGHAADALVGWIKNYGTDRFVGSVYHETLNRYIDDRGIENLVKLTQAKNGSSLKHALVLMAYLNNPTTLKTVIEFLGNPELQDDLVEAVASVSPKILKNLRDTLQTTTDRGVQKAITIILGRVGNESVIDDLCPLLGIDEELTLLAAGALAKIGSQNAYSHLIQYIGNPNPVVRRAIISALNSISHPQMPYDLKHYIYSPNPYEQESAIRIAGYFGYPQYVNAVVDATASPVTNVAVAANEVLPFFDGVTDIAKIYLKSIEQGDVRIKIAVAKALTFLSPTEALTLIEKLVTDPDPWVRNYTIRSAIALQLSGFKNAFMAIAADENEITFVRLAALQALGELKLVNPNYFIPFVNNSNSDIVQTAIHALSLNKSVEAEKILLDILDGTHDEKVKTAAAGALAGFDSSNASRKLFENARGLSKVLAEKCTETLGLNKNPMAYSYLLELCIDSRVGNLARKTIVQKKQHNIDELKRFLERGFEYKMFVIELLSQISLPGKEELLYQLKNDKNIRVREGAKALLESFILNL